MTALYKEDQQLTVKGCGSRESALTLYWSEQPVTPFPRSLVYDLVITPPWDRSEKFQLYLFK